jgi:hypothetical protein
MGILPMRRRGVSPLLLFLFFFVNFFFLRKERRRQHMAETAMPRETASIALTAAVGLGHTQQSRDPRADDAVRHLAPGGDVVRCRFNLAFGILSGLLAAASVLAQPAQPVSQPTPASAPSLDEQVQKAIQRGVDKIWALQDKDGNWPIASMHQRYVYTAGSVAMCAYALLESGVSVQEPRMAKLLDWLSKNNDQLTYTLGLRCQIWLNANRQTKNKYIKEFEADVKRLILASPDGRYDYDTNPPGPQGVLFRNQGSNWDNSNGQFGFLGVWAGARANMEFIPPAYWAAVAKHWMASQNADGGFQYRAGGGTESLSSGAMTAAGVANLLVCMDNVPDDALRSCQASQRPELKAIARGLDWLGQNIPRKPDEFDPYYLYSLERVGLAGGYKYFGTADWYKLGAEALLKTEQNGLWQSYGPSPVGTVWAVLFLVRGRNPVLFNKLQYSGDWNNRPRALAGVTDWISRTFEATLNWQIVNLKTPVSDWHDAPILFITGSRAPTFSDEDLGKLRAYVQQGGTIFSAAECGGANFGKAMRATYAKLFPDYELKPADKDHELYNIQFRLKGKPHFHILTNGVRPLAIHVENEDMDLPWQLKSSATEAWAYQGAANLYLYVTDKGSLKEGSLRARGTKHWPDEPPPAPRAVKLARLKYAGNWNPEPLAYERLGRLMSAQEKVGLDTVTTDFKGLPASGAAVATLTGTGALALDDQEKAALKKFVEGGGLLIVDAAGGNKAMADSAESMVGEIFGAGSLKRLDPACALYSARPIKEYKYRRQARARLGGDKEPQLKGVMLGERLGVVLSREDLTCGLVGYASYSCDGYMPQTACEIMTSAILLGAGAAPSAAASQSTSDSRPAE